MLHRTSVDLFTLQADLAHELTAALSVRLTREQKQRLARRHTANPSAYRLYLRGRYYWSQLTPAGNRAALEHYGRAIERDANYALA